MQNNDIQKIYARKNARSEVTVKRRLFAKQACDEGFKYEKANFGDTEIVQRPMNVLYGAT
jgi:hypothetical protein